jgi:PTH1 family peptidyl-tRNA hydrolase
MVLAAGMLPERQPARAGAGGLGSIRVSLNFKLLVGLGNPGAKYENTRHNAGFWFLDEIARRYRLVFQQDQRFQGALARLEFDGESVYLLKPMTFMNRAGLSVGALARYYKIEPATILVAHDELDFAPGVVRLKRGGGHGGHNGLRDVIAHLGAGEFFRLRLGIGHPGEKAAVVSYVLESPPRDGREVLQKTISTVADFLPEILNGDLQGVMNRLHTASLIQPSFR